MQNENIFVGIKIHENKLKLNSMMVFFVSLLTTMLLLDILYSIMVG